MEFRRLGKYEIVGKIGEGGMGEVYRAHDPVLGRDVAIKTMVAGPGVDDELRRRFHREAQSAARLNHPNITTVYDFGEEQGRMYIAMELLEGSDLKELISDTAPLPLDTKLALMAQICDGLAFAHSRDVIHRDLKPGNIRVLASGQVKIMDFGLARVSTSEMTRAGLILGTPNYMSPEQIKGDRATARSDVFALGAVFYELLSGRKSFDADSLTGVMYQVMQSDPPPLENLDPRLPRPLCEWVRRAMAKDPSQRYADAGKLLEALRRAQAASGLLTPSPVSTPGRGETLPARGPETQRAEWDGTVAVREATTPAPHWLAETRAEPARAEMAPTSAGGPPTRVPAPTRSFPPGRRSPLPLVVTVGLLAVAGAVAVGLWLSTGPSASVTRDASPPPPTIPATTAPPVTAAPVPTPERNALEAASQSFSERDYRTAVSRAGEVLAADPGNAAARDLRDRARRAVRDIDDAASAVRQGLAAGDAERASKALDRLTSLDPRHPEASALTARLNDLLRQQTEEARRALERARRDSVPPPSLPPATMPPATTPPHTVPATLPPATLPPATVPAAQSEAVARQGIRGVLDEYRAAFETRNVDALKAVQPGVDYQAMKQVFSTVTGYTVRLDVKEVTVKGDTATARCVVTYSPVPKPAGKIQPVPTIFHLRKTGELWLIERLERN